MKDNAKYLESFYYEGTTVGISFLLFFGLACAVSVGAKLLIHDYEAIGITILFGITGAVMITVGMIMLRRSSGRRRLECELKETGVRVSADVTDCIYTQVRVKDSRGRHRLRKLLCSCSIDYRTYVFKSRDLYRDPTSYLLPDKKVIVYYDRNDISRYFVDVDGSVAENYDSNINHFKSAGMEQKVISE